MASCTFNSLALNIAHKFGISDHCTKQCVSPEQMNARLAEPSSCTVNSIGEHSAGAEKVLNNLYTYYVIFFGILMHGVLIFLFIVVFGASLSI